MDGVTRSGDREKLLAMPSERGPPFFASMLL